FGTISLLDGLGKFLGRYLNNGYGDGVVVDSESLHIVLFHLFGDVTFSLGIASRVHADGDVWHDDVPSLRWVSWSITTLASQGLAGDRFGRLASGRQDDCRDNDGRRDAWGGAVGRQI